MEHDLSLVGHYNYWVAIILMMIGLYVTIVSNNLVKKLIGLAIFQTSVLLFYISLAWVEHSIAPILREGLHVYTNPLPHVLMLTAIVVGVATLAVGLALAIRIRQAYGTINEAELVRLDNLESSGQLQPEIIPPVPANPKEAANVTAVPPPDNGKGA